MTPAGSQVEEYRVWVRTDRGSTGSIDVNAEDWNDENLPGILEEFADKLDLAFDLME